MKPKAYILMMLVIGAALGCARSPSQLHHVNVSAIFGGTDVLPNEKLARTVVAVHSIYPGANEGTICSGTIISDSLVITAAHCLVDKGVSRTILFGVNAKEPVGRRRVVHETSHPGWAKIETIHAMPQEERSVADHVTYLNSSWSDIAVLKFEGGLPEGFVASKILTDADLIKPTAKVIAAGYGISDPSEGTGNGILRSTELSIDNPNYHADEFTIEQTERGTCEGDSGGPIFIKDGADLVLAGITSHGINDEACRGKTVFTFLSRHAVWLATSASELVTLFRY